MSEYGKQAAFLKLLLSYDDSPQSRLLLERLAQAKRNEHCIFSACLLVGLIASFGLAGLGYSAVLLPQFFHSSVHVLVRLFGALGLGSALCLLLFLGLWLYYRAAVNRLHEETRRMVARMLEIRLATPPLAYCPDLVDDPPLKIFGRPTGNPDPLRRAV